MAFRCRVLQDYTVIKKRSKKLKLHIKHIYTTHQITEGALSPILQSQTFSLPWLTSESLLLSSLLCFAESQFTADAGN